MLFTPGQLMTAFALSKQQWRTYRQALGPLNAGGRSPCFSASDLLATAVIRSVSMALQMPLSSFNGIAESLFLLCQSHSWPQLERSYLSLSIGEAEARLFDIDQRPVPSAVAIIVQLRPLVAELRETLLAVDADSQLDIIFPPMIAGGRK